MGNRNSETDQVASAGQARGVDIHDQLHGDSWGPAGSIMRVADTTGKKAESGAGTAKDAASQGPLTKAEQLVVDAEKALMKQPNAEGMKLAEPKFQAAIKQADSDFDALNKTISKEFAAHKPDFVAAEQKRQATQLELAATVSKIPEGERGKVVALCNAWAAVDQNDPVRAAVESDLKKYAGLGDKLKAVDAADNDPLVKKMDAWKTQLTQAFQDKAETRLGYSGGLEAVGRNDEAYEQLKQASELLGVPIPPKPTSNQPGMLRA